MAVEIPVYLFTGFLDSGKTTFIQEVLEEEEFNFGERTLLLLCEQGEVEYDRSRFYNPKRVYIEHIKDESDLTESNLAAMLLHHKASRVVIEWNGMWNLNNLSENVPENWLLYQQTMFVDANTFLLYNTNLRQQTFDQLKGAELIVFNRCKKNGFKDWQLEVHKICRVANRNNQIVYEFNAHDVIVDDIEDPLPYDMTKKRLDIKEEYYAEWYRDLTENQDDYQSKEVFVKGMAVIGDELAPDEMIFGRHVMTCCEDDIAFAGSLCKADPEMLDGLKNGDWVDILAEVRNEYTPIYGEVGPVFYCSKIEKTTPCDPEVATF